jgi:hypothetical protein
LLAGDFSKTLKEHNLDQEGLLLSLYGFRNYLHSPELKNFALMALYKLCNKFEFTVQDKHAFEEHSKLLTQQKLVHLLEQTLADCEQAQSNSCEIELLKALLLSGVWYDFTLSTICLSPQFIKTFKEHYPKAKSFTTIEHCLLTADNGNSTFLIDIPSMLNNEINDDDLVNYCTLLREDKSKELTQVIDDLKNTLQYSFSAEIIKSNEANNGEEISIKSKKTVQKPKSVVSGYPDVFFQSTNAEHQPQSENQDSPLTKGHK